MPKENIFSGKYEPDRDTCTEANESNVARFRTAMLWIPSQSRQKNSPKENVQVGRDNAVCIFVLLISGKYNRCRLVNVGGERCA